MQHSIKDSLRNKIWLVKLFFVLLISPLLVSMIFAEGHKYPIGEKVYGEVKSDKALIYFIRPTIYNTSGNSLYADDKFLTYIVDNTYSFAYVEPGRHLIWFNLDRGISEYEIEFIPGQTYYILVNTKISFLDEENGNILINKVNHYIEADSDLPEKESQKAAKNYLKAQSNEMKKEKATIAQIPITQMPANPDTYLKIQAFSQLKLQFLENISSGINRTGDTVWLMLAEDFSINQQTCFRKGTLVKGSILQAARKGGMWKQGLLHVTIPAVLATDGNRIPTIGQVITTGSFPSGGKQIVYGLLGGLMGSVLFKGKDTFIPAGQKILVWTRGENWINPASISPIETKITPVPGNALVINSVCLKNIEFPSRNLNQSVIITVQTSEPIKEIQAYAIGDLVLPEPCKPLKVIEGKTGWDITFKEWDLLRFFDQDQKSIKLSGVLSDGTVFTSEVFILMKEKQ